MLKSAYHLIIRNRASVLFLWGCAMAGVVTASLQPGLAPPGEFQLDKLIHFAVYAALSALPLAAIGQRGAAIAIGIVMVGSGLLVEWLQGFVPGRSASLGDALANGAGSVAGIVLWIALNKCAARHARTAAPTEGHPTPHT